MPYLDPEARRRANRAAQKRWRERLMSDPEKYEAFKRKERRRNRLRYQQNPEYAERHQQLNRDRYHADPEVRERARKRREVPENRQRSRALRCLNKGLSAHLPDQLKIVKQRLERLLKQIDET